MSAFQVPWYVGSTFTKTVHCASCGHDVTVRFLSCGGRPLSLIGCSEPDCTMACLDEPPLPDAEPSSVEPESATTRP